MKNIKDLIEEKRSLDKKAQELEKHNKQIMVLQQSLLKKDVEIRDVKQAFLKEENELARKIIHEKVIINTEREKFQTELESVLIERAMKLVTPYKEEITQKNFQLVDQVRKYETMLKNLGKERLDLEDENSKLKRDSHMHTENVLGNAKEGINRSIKVSITNIDHNC